MRDLDHLPVAGYLRVSTDSPEQLVSIETQRLALKAVCDILIEDVLSSSDFARKRRPGWDELEMLVAGPRVRAIRFVDLSRLARDGTDMDLIAMCHSQGVQVLDLAGKEWEIRTPEGLLLCGTTSLMNRVQSRMISAKVRGALKVRRAEGKLARGVVPFGYLHLDGEAVRHPQQWAAARDLVDRLLRTEMNISATILALPRDHPWHPTPAGLRSWWKNPMLRGGIGRDWCLKTRVHLTVEWGRAPALVTHDEWLTGQRLLEMRKCGQRRGSENKPRLFSGMVVCASCKHHLHSHHMRGQSPRYICRCSWCDWRAKGLSYKTLKAAAINALVEHRIQQMAALADCEEQPLHPEVARLESQLERLQALSDEGLEGLVGQMNRLRDQIAVLRMPREPCVMDAQLEEAFSDPQTLADLSDEDLRPILTWFIKELRYLGNPKGCKVVLRGSGRVAPGPALIRDFESPSGGS